MTHGTIAMGGDKTDGRPRKGFHPTEAHRRKFSKNIAVMLMLIGIGALLYLLGIIELLGG